MNLLKQKKPLIAILPFGQATQPAESLRRPQLLDAHIVHQAVIRRLLAGIVKLEVRKELDRRFAFGVNPAEEKPLDVNVLLGAPFGRVEIILREARCWS